MSIVVSVPIMMVIGGMTDGKTAAGLQPFTSI